MQLSLAFSAISLILCVLFFFYFRSFLKRRTAAEELLAQYRDEAYRLIAEIDAVTDRDSLLVEERIKTLKELLEDTDKRVAVYVRELDRSRTGEALYSSLGRGIRAALTPQPAVLEPDSIQNVPEVNAIPPAAEPSAETGPSLKTGKRRSQRNTGTQELQPQELRPQIADLAARGLSPEQIAARLHLRLSEVDLALNLLGKG